MIKASTSRNSCTKVKVNAGTNDMFFEMAMIIRDVRKAVTESHGDDFTHVFMEQAIKYAYAKTEEQEEEVLNETAERVNALGGYHAIVVEND